MNLIKRIGNFFWISFAVAIFSFFCPFVEEETGLGIYKDIFKLIRFGPLDAQLLFVCFLLACILVWLPIMAYSFHRYTIEKRRYTIRQRLINYFLFAIGFSVYALPIYLHEVDAFIFELINWGYWLLMVCMTVMFICYLIIQKKQLIDEDEISKHLVNND